MSSVKLTIDWEKYEDWYNVISCYFDLGIKLDDKLPVFWLDEAEKGYCEVTQDGCIVHIPREFVLREDIVGD